jgi:hypothetical protein
MLLLCLLLAPRSGQFSPDLFSFEPALIWGIALVARDQWCGAAGIDIGPNLSVTG